jgi:hypothetical protein
VTHLPDQEPTTVDDDPEYSDELDIEDAANDGRKPDANLPPDEVDEPDE